MPSTSGAPRARSAGACSSASKTTIAAAPGLSSKREFSKISTGFGYVPDVYTTDEFAAAACAGRQTDREAIYHAALDGLAARGLVYGCDCSRRSARVSRGAGRSRRASLPGAVPRQEPAAFDRPRLAPAHRQRDRDLRRPAARPPGAGTSARSAAISCCGIGTATGPTSSRWRWTTGSRGSTSSSAASICWHPPAGRFARAITRPGADARLPSSSADHEIAGAEVEQVRRGHRGPGVAEARMDGVGQVRAAALRGGAQSA